jgi:fibronectin type 3 domain-containing protein
LTASGLLLSRLVYPWPASSSGFVVYEVGAPDADPKTLPALPAAQPFPKLLTQSPVAELTFTDARIEFGATRCYVVRTIDTVGTGSVESVSSAPVCVKPKDVFAPAAPKGLQAVASEGAVSLIWEANTETDLAGYIVLRAAAPSTNFQPLTPQPIKETTFRDINVRRGVRYVYVVVAVDAATPPNRSEPSDRAEEVPR